MSFLLSKIDKLSCKIKLKLAFAVFGKVLHVILSSDSLSCKIKLKLAFGGFGKVLHVILSSDNLSCKIKLKLAFGFLGKVLHNKLSYLLSKISQNKNETGFCGFQKSFAS